VTTGVDEALMRAWTFLHIGGCGEDGWNDRAGYCLRLLSDVEGSGRECLFSFVGH